MSIYKRKETWWIKFTTPDGRRIQQSAGTKIKHEAQELHDRLKSEAWRVGKLGDKPALHLARSRHALVARTITQTQY